MPEYVSPVLYQDQTNPYSVTTPERVCAAGLVLKAPLVIPVNESIPFPV